MFKKTSFKMMMASVVLAVLLSLGSVLSVYAGTMGPEPGDLILKGVITCINV